MTATMNSEPKFSRAEMRRLWKENKRHERHKASGFLDFGSYVGFRIRPSKYMPHIGNKQKGL
jgi:hypothetical protein